MRTFAEIGVNVIKCQNRQTCDRLKEIQYKINAILYPLPKRVASKRAICRLREQLITYGKELSAISCPNIAEPKRQEIIAIIREMCRNLGAQLKNEMDISQDEANRVFRYQVSQYIKKRSSTMTDNDIIMMLEQNKELAEDYPNPTSKFLDMQNELLEELNKKYKI